MATAPALSDNDVSDIFEEDTKMTKERAEIARVTPNMPVKAPGIGIEGLEDIPASIMPIPYVRLVQPSSKKIEIGNGKEAESGSYYFNDTQEAFPVLEFAILKAKYGETAFKRDNEIIKGSRIAILAVTLTDFRPFILTLSVMSFTNFGQLVSKLKVKGISKIWEYKIQASSDKQENDKGKYYVAKFEIKDKLDDETISKLEEKLSLYGGSLDRNQNDEEISV
jgi:hypothetical protein